MNNPQIIEDIKGLLAKILPPYSRAVLLELVYSHKGWAKRSFLPFYKNVEKDKIILYQS